MAMAAPAWTDFSSRIARPASPFAPLTTKLAGGDRPVAEPEQVPDPAALVAAARVEGRREGEARARLAGDQALAASAQAHADALAAERRRWAEAEAATLAAGFSEAIRALEDRLAESTARVLLPFLAEGLRREALRELTAIVSPLTAEGRYATLSIAGPADLVGTLGERLGLAEDAVAIRIDEAPDVRVQVDDTVIETRLESWSRRLSLLVEER